MYEKYSTRGVSRGKYSTRLRLVLYLPLDTPPRAVFPVHTRGSALTHIDNTIHSTWNRACLLQYGTPVMDSSASARGEFQR